MNVPFSLLLAVEWAIHPGTVAAGKEVYPDIARKSVGQLAASAVVTITGFGRDPSFVIKSLE
jgi:hypothetical protein